MYRYFALHSLIDIYASRGQQLLNPNVYMILIVLRQSAICRSFRCPLILTSLRLRSSHAKWFEIPSLAGSITSWLLARGLVFGELVSASLTHGIKQRADVGRLPDESLVLPTFRRRRRVRQANEVDPTPRRTMTSNHNFHPSSFPWRGVKSLPLVCCMPSAHGSQIVHDSAMGHPWDIYGSLAN